MLKMRHFLNFSIYSLLMILLFFTNNLMAQTMDSTSVTSQPNDSMKIQFIATESNEMEEYIFDDKNSTNDRELSDYSKKSSSDQYNEIIDSVDEISLEALTETDQKLFVKNKTDILNSIQKFGHFFKLSDSKIASIKNLMSAELNKSPALIAQKNYSGVSVNINPNIGLSWPKLIIYLFEKFPKLQDKMKTQRFFIGCSYGVMLGFERNPHTGKRKFRAFFYHEVERLTSTLTGLLRGALYVNIGFFVKNLNLTANVEKSSGTFLGALGTIRRGESYLEYYQTAGVSTAPWVGLVTQFSFEGQRYNNVSFKSKVSDGISYLKNLLNEHVLRVNSCSKVFL